MSTTTEMTEQEVAERNAQYEKARQEKIAKSKILANGVQSELPFGIMDILFYNSETKKTTRYTGGEEADGKILMILPVRTIRDLTKFAVYSIPSDWKMKFHKGQQVYPVTNSQGYIQKLIPASSMGSSNSFIDPKQAMKNAAAQAQKDFDTAPENNQEPTAKPEAKAEGPAGDGFDDTEDKPF